ncbi:hypothetical protein ASPVEDRAFT_392309 [Aspergillus versicolor CBS 583.65]|uniref:Uncharacterized protein n=1 Tax=Aspergillus versicolor CBS 583.65 TaxID=1036611 RepID=A0A1L9Q3E5_ASPVE|nr:uncharacterized protein ASPVEDRAFT_392309 [Aspergillus versicolor CBS 583.65]OJJ08232.1 hypothetical protein ASPVEDRAFT_392309 [Aspergillus versicolor CBS 583.65]
MAFNLNSHPPINCFLSNPANRFPFGHSLCYGAMGGWFYSVIIGWRPRDPDFTGCSDVAACGWGVCHVPCRAARFQDSSKIFASSFSGSSACCETFGGTSAPISPHWLLRNRRVPKFHRSAYRCPVFCPVVPTFS